MSDSHTHDHPIAGYTFLLLVAVGLAFGSKAAIQHSAEAHEAQKAAAIEAEKQRVKDAVAVGQAGDYARAEQLLEALSHERPDDADILFNLGISKAAQEKDDDADKLFARVLELDPKDFDAVAERAGIKRRKNLLDETFILLDKIPVGEGHLKERLMRDPLWADLMNEPRMIELAKKHGVPVEPHDTTVRNLAPEQGDAPKDQAPTPTPPTP